LNGTQGLLVYADVSLLGASATNNTEASSHTLGDWPGRKC